MLRFLCWLIFQHTLRSVSCARETITKSITKDNTEIFRYCISKIVCTAELFQLLFSYILRGFMSKQGQLHNSNLAFNFT
jgi:hypothetical protein